MVGSASSTLKSGTGLVPKGHQTARARKAPTKSNSNKAQLCAKHKVVREQLKGWVESWFNQAPLHRLFAEGEKPDAKICVP
jgi:hypothetical protein